MPVVCVYDVRTNTMPPCSHSKRIMIVDLDLEREKSILHISETIQNSMLDLWGTTVRVKEKIGLVRCRDCIVLLFPERGRIAKVMINHVCLILTSVSSYSLLLTLLMI